MEGRFLHSLPVTLIVSTIPMMLPMAPPGYSSVQPSWSSRSSQPQQQQQQQQQPCQKLSTNSYNMLLKNDINTGLSIELTNLYALNKNLIGTAILLHFGLTFLITLWVRVVLANLRVTGMNSRHIIPAKKYLKTSYVTTMRNPEPNDQYSSKRLLTARCPENYESMREG